MASHFTTLFLLSFLYFSQFSISFSAQKFRCHPDDYKALMKIKRALNNPYLLASWKPNTDCCDWYCLKCGLNSNRVTDLILGTDNKLSGQIPSAIGDLPYLTFIRFHKLPGLTGSIPESITKLKNLSILELNWNGLSGPIPEFLSNLTNLEYLELNYNKFSGSIPRSFSKFTKLEALHLDRNQLTGVIPDSFGHFTGRVPQLYLSHNQLSGTIPKSFANMDFERIDLSRNKLTGDASMLFKPKGSTQMLDISRNMFEFDFSKVKFPRKSLVWLDVNHNKIYGSIPKDIVKVDLQFFNASYNRLCGEIPTGENMAGFDDSTYFHNKCLCGPPLPNKCK